MTQTQVFPTHVGMNRRTHPASRPRIRIPHARGDEPAALREQIVLGKYSPRTWG